MKKKQKRKWCQFPKPKFDHDTKKHHYRCECGKRLHLIPIFDFWDGVRIKGHWVPEIVFWTIPDHKTKVEYKNENL